MKSMRDRLCSWHRHGVDPEWKGPFYVPNCTKCDEKVRDGKTTKDAPNPESRGVGYAHRAHCGDAAFQKWIASRESVHRGRRAWLKTFKFKEAK